MSRVADTDTIPDWLLQPSHLLVHLKNESAAGEFFSPLSITVPSKEANK